MLDQPYNVRHSFSDDYIEARTKFRATCDEQGATSVTYAEPGSSPSGDVLSTDVSWIGSRDARHVVVLTSAAHGVEGICGSACQIDFLQVCGSALLPNDVAVLLVHAVNPFGFAWLRRQTQENVDLNRNGVDFKQPLPANPGYDEIRSALAPKSRSGQEFEDASETLRQYAEKLGSHAYRVARSAGQYVDPKGIHFGGFEPTWSRRNLEQIITDYDLGGRDQVAVIDYHTGLGPYGYGEPICGSRPTEAGARRGREWYGESMTEPMRGTSTSVKITGLMQYVWLREIGEASLTFIALEFGTFPRDEMHEATDEENWLVLQSGLSSEDPEYRRIKARFRRAYYPDTIDWKEMVLFRSRQVILQTLSGISGGGRQAR